MAGIKFFQVYLDCKQHIDMLSEQQAGQLFKALLDFATSGEVPELTDGMVKMAFSFMSAQIGRDISSYHEKCEKNRENSLKRWKKNATESGIMPPHANQCETCQEEEEEEEEKEEEKEEKEEYISSSDKSDSVCVSCSEIQKNKPHKIRSEDDFEECWKIYPKKEGKAEARKAYLKFARKNPDLKEKVISGIRNYIEEIKTTGKNYRYIMKGSTYFGNEHWNDEYIVKENIENETVFRSRNPDDEPF